MVLFDPNKEQRRKKKRNVVIRITSGKKMGFFNSDKIKMISKSFRKNLIALWFS